MLSNPSQSLTISVSNRRDGPCDQEQDKTLRHCVTLIEILIFPWGWLYSAESISAAAGWGLLTWNTWDYTWILQCFYLLWNQDLFSSSVYNNTSSGQQTETVRYQVVRLDRRKRNVFFLPEAVHVSAAPNNQSIHLFSITTWPSV